MIDFYNFVAYDRLSPSCLTWKVQRNAGRNSSGRTLCMTGDHVGSLAKTGYYVFGLQGKTHYSHRVIWEILVGPIPKGFEIDHVNKNRGDNRLENLRCVPRRVNLRNAGMRITNKSGVTGVCAIFSRGLKYWDASWRDVNSVKKTKRFSVNKLSDEGAFNCACEFRTLQISLLNSRGAGYSESHGT